MRDPILWILTLHLSHKTDSSLVKIAQFEEFRWQATPTLALLEINEASYRETGVENNIQWGAVHMSMTVVVNEARLPEPLRKQPSQHYFDEIFSSSGVAGKRGLMSPIRTIGPMSCNGPSNCTKLGAASTMIQQL